VARQEEREHVPPVGERDPNAWGLYDMHGNVGEWCYDLYDENYCGHVEVIDPVGPQSRSRRVLRGGVYCRDHTFCRSSARDFLYPLVVNSYHGFRVARTYD
jgi:formylglycine-generating enzyme required for sulfatase activity